MLHELVDEGGGTEWDRSEKELSFNTACPIDAPSYLKSHKQHHVSTPYLIILVANDQYFHILIALNGGYEGLRS